MSSANDASDSNARIQAIRVPDAGRMRALPRHFGRRLLTVEGSIYGALGRLAPEYKGAYWEMFELTNSGFYMAPQTEPLRLVVEGNGYDGLMSADAAGITACLFCYSELSFLYPDDLFSKHFLWLRDFAAQHAEAASIFAAID